MNWIWLLIILVLAISIPRYGFLALYRNWRSARQREQVEDALKHLLDREQGGRHASPESLAGTLDLPRVKATRLIADMESQDLLETHGAQLHLTTEGTRWAMHIVRAHRLWERYLVDEARMPLSKIHDEAQKREHSFTDEQLNELDAALGHPTLDPHGDPIPSREGKMLTVESMPITAWQAEGPARIVHIEDEPAIAYDQILAAGLRLGQVIRILERTPQRIVLSDGETEYRLAPTVAANVSVAPLLASEIAKANAVPLATLTQDQRGEIVSLDDAVQGFTRRRFLDLGLTPGTTIYPELGNFFGDPRAYRVRGTLIALRKDQAAQIWVKRSPKSSDFGLRDREIMTDKKLALPTDHCEECPAFYQLEQMGFKIGDFDRVVALAGNPNTGKSTVFNALTRLKQHTGNWPGKTVTRAEGGYQFNGVRYKLVDLPGTYSLLSASQDEEVARDFILFGKPDCTVVVTDATALERNLNLVLQVMEITDRVVVAINLMDEAKRKGLEVDARSLSRDLGIPAIPITARSGEGIHTLLATVADLINGDLTTKPLRVGGTPEFQHAVNELVSMIEQMAPGIPNARWLAIRLLDGDAKVQQALVSGELAQLVQRQQQMDVRFSSKMSVEGRQ